MRPPTWWGCEPLWPSLCQEEQTVALSGRGAGSSSPSPDPGGQRPRDHRAGVEIQALLAWPPPPMCNCAFKGPPNLSVPQFPLVQGSIHKGIHSSNRLWNRPERLSFSHISCPIQSISKPVHSTFKTNRGSDHFPACTSSNTSKPSTALAWLFTYPVITRWLSW